jgi:hypothetical protein
MVVGPFFPAFLGRPHMFPVVPIPAFPFPSKVNLLNGPLPTGNGGKSNFCVEEEMERIWENGGRRGRGDAHGTMSLLDLDSKMKGKREGDKTI